MEDTDERRRRFKAGGKGRLSMTGVPEWEVGADGIRIELGTGLTQPEEGDKE